MTPVAFILITLVLLGGAAVAMVLRQPVHAALAAAVTFVGLGAAFIALGAEFIGLVQWMVNVGAVAILILFVILLTRPASAERVRLSRVPLGGALTAAAVLVALGFCLASSPSLHERTANATATAPIKAIGQELMTGHLVPLQALAVLFTAALIGAALFVWDEKPGPPDDAP